MRREFGKCAVALRNEQDQDRALNEVEMLFIENHFHVVQMAYLRWKQKHMELPTYSAQLASMRQEIKVKQTHDHLPAKGGSATPSLQCYRNATPPAKLILPA
jgi:hypothetical protein